MRAGVLNYPYIQVPSSESMTRRLLYWDDVATIVPDAWAYGDRAALRELLGDFTFELVELGLVSMAIPLDVDGSPVADYLAGLDEDEIDQRRAGFVAGRTLRVHKGKFVEMGLLDILKGEGLATEADDWMWMTVERTTAMEFLAALAGLLAARPGVAAFEPAMEADDDGTPIQLVPVTENSEAFLAMGGLHIGDERHALVQRLTRVRAKMFNGLFPAPTEGVSSEWLAEFKRDNGHLLRDFRLAMERRIFDVVQRSAEGAEEDHDVDLASRELGAQMDEISARMQAARGRKIRKVALAVVGEIPIVGRFFGAAEKAADAVTKDPLPDAPTDRRLQYGALLRRAMVD